MTPTKRSNQVSHPVDERRRLVRRGEDAALRQTQNQQNLKLKSLLELGRLISSDLRLENILNQIAQKASELMNADRCSIFLYDPTRDELWTTVALGVQGQIIRVPAQAGIAGYCFQNAAVINLKDAYNDPRFNQEVDVSTGYRTKNILCLPICNRDQEVLGVIQLLNKTDGDFSDEDEVFLKTYANHAGIFLEIAQLQKAQIQALEYSREELRRLNRAKDKALDRLSHELRTPIAVIQGNIRVLNHRLLKIDPQPVRMEFFGTMEKHLDRLLEIQAEADTIIRFSMEQEAENLVNGLKETWQKLEDQESIPPAVKAYWVSIREWLNTTPLAKPLSFQEVDLWAVAEKALSKVKERASHRELFYFLEGERPLSVLSPSKILEEVLEGLLKNAIENTPDEGRILIVLGREVTQVYLKVQDSGVGIIEEDQKFLFDGLYHTRSTELYTSKRPFDFGAGGKGLDLLRARVSGRHFNFGLSAESRRCIFLPRDTDQCPGRISRCPHCRTFEDCQKSGSTTFCLSFPDRERLVGTSYRR